MASDQPEGSQYYTAAKDGIFDPDRPPLMMKTKVRGELRTGWPVKMLSFLPGSARNIERAVVIQNAQRIVAWSPRVFNALCRYEYPDPTPFGMDDPDALEFLLRWMANDLEGDENGVIFVEISLYVKAALIAERFHHPAFWDFHLDAFYECSQVAVKERYLLLPPLMCIRVDMFTEDASPIRRAIVDVCTYRDDVGSVGHVVYIFNRLIYNGLPPLGVVNQVHKHATPGFMTLLNREVMLLQASPDRKNPFDIEERVWRHRYSYPPGFISELTSNPLLPFPEGTLPSASRDEPDLCK